MSAFNVVVVLIVVGFLLWLVNLYVPMDSKIKKVLNVFVTVVVVVWLLQLFGFVDQSGNFRIR